MIKNITYRRWFAKIFPIKYAKIAEDKFNRDLFNEEGFMHNTYGEM